MATILVTGANRGIGLAFARALVARGDAVIGTVRRPEDAADLSSAGARLEELEVTDDTSVGALAEHLAGQPIDMILNNAGILRRDRLDSTDPATLLRQFDVNALGPLRVVRALLPNLKLAAHPKIVNITSRMGSIADNASGGFYGYRASKAALNAVTKSLAVDLSPWPVVCIHPGYVRTRLTNHQGEVTAEEAVEKMLVLIDKLDAASSGKFFHRDGHEIPW